jgi:hypothetical protein
MLKYIFIWHKPSTSLQHASLSSSSLHISNTNRRISYIHRHTTSSHFLNVIYNILRTLHGFFTAVQYSTDNWNFARLLSWVSDHTETHYKIQKGWQASLNAKDQSRPNAELADPVHNALTLALVIVLAAFPRLYLIHGLHHDRTLYIIGWNA